MSSEVRFPVLRSLAVRNYALYPGSGDGSGFSVDLLPGMSVIVGINGIGKTTLLNLMLWVLTGPHTPKKADLMRPGSGRHERTKTKNFEYFAARIGGPIHDAEATLEFAFGSQDTIKITRSLANLKVKELWHNKTKLQDPDEERYLDLVKELSGAQSDWDFDFVVRHLVFFLEEKSPLLWGEEGQFELLRILFLNAALSRNCVKLSDEIYALDSKIRNRNWHLNELREELALLEEAAAPQDGAADSLVVLEERQAASEENLTEATSNVEVLQQRVETLEKEEFESEQRLDEARLKLRHVEQQYFRHAFPGLPAATELTLGRLLANDGCLVCGSDVHHAQERLRRLQAVNACPVCETPQVAAGDDAVTEITPARLKKLERQVSELALQYEGTRSLLQQSREELRSLKEDQREEWREQAKLTSLIADLRAQGPMQDERTATLRAQLVAAESDLDEQRGEWESKRKQYRVLLGKARDRISEVAEQICREFSGFATTFLEEDCQLEYQLTRRTLGQSGAQMEFPSFIVKMSSATSQTMRTREAATQVSESQKEFLDLAFRMAVLRTAVDRGAPTMLVIETPEASLDHHFVARAGRMLRDFTYENSKIRHTVIASSNLNRENMIGSLLGLGQTRRSTPRAEIPRRVINLLEIAAKPKSLKKEEAAYNRLLKEALDAR
ncbi:AAA family ATPase [Methylibium sp.]|uniref:ATP-binding protein n=1 Tax=Methylibium sp. TaxID=2067992 RepID=UPI003D12B295